MHTYIQQGGGTTLALADGCLIKEDDICDYARKMVAYLLLSILPEEYKRMDVVNLVLKQASTEKDTLSLSPSTD